MYSAKLPSAMGFIGPLPPSSPSSSPSPSSSSSGCKNGVGLCTDTCSNIHVGLDCLVCGNPWGRHLGHSCPDGRRGSFGAGTEGVFGPPPPPETEIIGPEPPPSPPPPPPPPSSSSSSSPTRCGSDCKLVHSKGNCLVCGLGWGSHAGHICNFGRRQRGSWSITTKSPAAAAAHTTKTAAPSQNDFIGPQAPIDFPLPVLQFFKPVDVYVQYGPECLVNEAVRLEQQYGTPVTQEDIRLDRLRQHHQQSYQQYPFVFTANQFGSIPTVNPFVGVSTASSAANQFGSIFRESPRHTTPSWR